MDKTKTPPEDKDWLDTYLENALKETGISRKKQENQAKAVENDVFDGKAIEGAYSERNKEVNASKKKQQNQNLISMDIFKYLILGWSIVWASCLFSMSNIKAGTVSSVHYNLLMNDKFALLNLPVIAVFYSFIPWALGCILIALVLIIINRWVK